MAFYQKRGELRQKKHITFYKADGHSLYREELVGTGGFTGIYSTKYHVNAPTRVLDVAEELVVPDGCWADAPLKCYHFLTDGIRQAGDFLSARTPILSNDHVRILTAQPTENMVPFYKNAFASELIFVHRGEGSFSSEYGRLALTAGDYLLVPKGTVHRLDFDEPEKVKLFIVESKEPFEIPKAYRNAFGQILEDAPYSERDFKTPEFVPPVEEKGEYTILIKAGEKRLRYTVDHHPFDLVGWDGYLYPYTFNIADYCPVLGKVHRPPPVHFLFSSARFVVFNFTPRLFDFHPEAIPAPYFHSNVDCDEVIYYASGNFMSRTGVKEGSVTLHPMGVPHGPQPGKTEASIGKRKTDEYAVMVDTFDPLRVSDVARGARVQGYFRSWLGTGVL